MKRAAAALTLGFALALAVIVAACRGPGLLGSSATKETVCYECHIDFKGEELSTVHERAGVSCIRCHGQSQPHMDDEVRKTPPDAIFRGAATKVFCLTCHLGDYRKADVHAAEDAKAKAGGTPRACTACHGEHKLVRLEP